MKLKGTFEKERRWMETAEKVSAVYDEHKADISKALWDKIDSLVEQKKLSWTELAKSISVRFCTIMAENKRRREGQPTKLSIEILVRLCLFVIIKHDAQWFVDAIQKRKELLP